MATRATFRNASHPRAACTDIRSAYAAPFVCEEDLIPAADPLGDR
ncbi:MULTISPECIES: hypothetical protein [unclassified Streptomyces]|nr:hypothetical protein [Streptomyces sp. NBC_00589]WTI35692.1 hypothetical protein OIC96_12120 [Streptomyces sp. NBC_00775]WUB30634.1 hypothetical protein OHA51_37610 [Streptomyces sp. NBC_00589]